jgi:hypothetical protein
MCRERQYIFALASLSADAVRRQRFTRIDEDQDEVKSQQVFPQFKLRNGKCARSRILTSVTRGIAVTTHRSPLAG